MRFQLVTGSTAMLVEKIGESPNTCSFHSVRAQRRNIQRVIIKKMQ
ncbi:hypothetical protein OL548_29860 [Lysinibacillus sp. MHQ-1]|nr:hypothetical protein OL548_29860 [Lysinibacillus sp. MHQ-1]